MSLNKGERSDTRDELLANLALAGLSRDDVARALNWPGTRAAAAFDVAGAVPRDVWLVRDFLDRTVRAAGGTPRAWPTLTEEMRGAADSWFDLYDVDDVLNGKTR